MARGLTRLNATSSGSFRALTARDLGGFDKHAKALILQAIEHGCTGRVSAKGHCILRNTHGDTTAVPRSMSVANRSAQNSRAAVRRLITEQIHERST